MIQLNIDPLVKNATVYIVRECEGESVASEFLPLGKESNTGEPIPAVYINDKPKDTTRSQGMAEEKLVRKVDIYPKDGLSLVQQLETGTEVILITEAYGKEEGYLQGVQIFEGLNMIKLCICLGKK